MTFLRLALGLASILILHSALFTPRIAAKSTVRMKRTRGVR